MKSNTLYERRFEMKRSFKKVVAVVSAFALLIAGMSYVPQKVNADTSLTGNASWQSWFNAGGTVTSTDSSSEVVNGSIGETWWHVQTWLADVTFDKGYEYTGTFKVTADKPKQFRVDKRIGDGTVFDGEVSVSDWTQNGDGTYSCTYTGKTTPVATTSNFDLRISFGYFDTSNGAVGNGGELDGWSANDTINVKVSDFSLTRTEADITTQPAGEANWVEIAGGDGNTKYYYDKANMTVNEVVSIQQPGWSPAMGIYMNVPSGISEVSVNGVTENVAKIDGAGAIIYLSALTKDINEVEITHALGTAKVTIKKDGETPTEAPTESPTEAPTEATTEAPTEAPTTQPTGEADWVEIAGGDDTASYYYDKANMTVSSVINIQQPGWSPEIGIYMNVPSGISAVSVNGVTENVAKIDGAGAIIYLSALTQEINEVEITHALGTAKVSIKKVEKAQTVKHSVTINGNKVAEVEDGSTYTLGDAQYGYYTDGKIYKPGTVLTITDDIALTSIDSLSVDMANGAAIKLSTPAGLKFQAKVSSNNGEAVKSDAIKEGMLITTNDIYENNSSALDLTSSYTMLNIVNEGWFDESAMTYCGAVANISEANYTRDFIARAYVTITYTDNTSVTVYSGMSQTRSVSYVASAVKAAGYPGIAASEIPVIDSFIK